MFKNSILNTINCNGQYYENFEESGNKKNYEHFWGGGGGNKTTVNDRRILVKN